MLLLVLLLVPLLGVFLISASMSYELSAIRITRIKSTALKTSFINWMV